MIGGNVGFSFLGQKSAATTAQAQQAGEAKHAASPTTPKQNTVEQKDAGKAGQVMPLPAGTVKESRLVQAASVESFRAPTEALSVERFGGTSEPNDRCPLLDYYARSEPIVQ